MSALAPPSNRESDMTNPRAMTGEALLHLFLDLRGRAPDVKTWTETQFVLPATGPDRDVQPSLSASNAAS